MIAFDGIEKDFTHSGVDYYPLLLFGAPTRFLYRILGVVRREPYVFVRFSTFCILLTHGHLLPFFNKMLPLY